MSSRALPFAVIGLSFVFFWALVVNAMSGGTLTDPAEILTRGAEATAEADSFAFAATFGGGITDPMTGTQDVPLDGVELSGEVDVAGEAAHVTFAFPALFGLSGEAIVIGSDTYLLTSLTGDKWVHSTSEPMPEESPAPDAGEIADKVAELLATEGVTLHKLDDTACGNDTCYQLRLTIPAEVLAEHGGMPDMGDLGGGMGDLLPEDLFGGPMVLDLQFQHDGLWLRQVATGADAGEDGAFTVSVDFRDYNADFDISAPPADQVTEEGEFPLFQ
ncbi:MAG TPA: hypothetical protein VJ259_03555 [Actinomycetota bacterium]|nr:hypothetical protein [Actinomycetota bacterium]